MLRRLLNLRSFLVGVALLIAASDEVRSDDNGHELALRLLQEGRIRPLAEITAAVHAKVPGEVIEVELEDDDGVYVYEFKILRPNGRVQEVEVDAATAKVIKVEDDD